MSLTPLYGCGSLQLQCVGDSAGNCVYPELGYNCDDMKIWMASATMSTHVLANLTPAASATVLVRFTTADVQASRQEIATATATSLTPLASAAVRVRPMRTPMASATTSTHVSESSTLAACATDRVRSTSADALTSLKATATARATSLTPSAVAAASLPETDVNDNLTHL